MIAIVEITKACNLRCQHCCVVGERGVDLPLDVFVRSLEQMRDRFHDFRFVGGEPLMDADRLEVALTLVSGWGKRTSITTNGFFVSGMRERLARWPLNSVCLSVDGGEAAHNAQRGHAQAYERVKEAAQVLGEIGIPVQVAFCVTRLNCDELGTVYEFCEHIGAEFLRIQPLVPLSRKARSVLLSPPELDDFLGDARALNGTVEVRTPESLCLLPGVSRCVAGERWIYVCSDGIVMPCIYAPIPIGRIDEDPVDELIAKARFDLPARGCQACDSFLCCRGGCRGAAWTEFGDFHAPDPRCRIAQDAGWVEAARRTAEGLVRKPPAVVLSSDARGPV